MSDHGSRLWLVGLSLAAAALFVLGWWSTWTGQPPPLGAEAQRALACVLVALCLSRLAALGVRLARLEAELALRRGAPRPRAEVPPAAPPVFSHRLRELGIELEPDLSAPERRAEDGRGTPHAA